MSDEAKLIAFIAAFGLVLVALVVIFTTGGVG